MKNYKVIALCLLNLLFTPFVSAQKIHTIGDSTMADYDESTTDKRGWGQMFQQFFDDAITVNNRGKSGASSKSFYEESAYWTSVKKQIAEGDYVIIQFSHNDEKNNGMDGDSVIAKTGDSSVDYRGTIPQSTYKNYLRKYVEETWELGANPILVAPMCRKYFSGNTITRSGRHDLGDKFSILNDDGTISENQSIPESDHTMDYPYAMQEVAEEMGVPFIDLTTLSAELYISYGESACTELLFCTDDSTHPCALGATLIAHLVAQEMYSMGILADHIQQNTDLLVNPTSLDFGKVYVNQAVVKEVSVSGMDLTPSEGSLTVTVPEGFTVSTDKSEYSSSISLDYTNGNLTYTTLYVKAQMSEAGIISGTITFTNGNNTREITVSCEGVSLVGGAEVLLQWELSANDSYTLTGPAEAIPESWSEMVVKNYAVPNSSVVWPDDSGISTDQKTQRNLIEGETWPGGEIDEVSTRYIQFGITASESSILHIDSIGLYVCGAGGSGMRCRVSYSLYEDFSDAHVVAEFASSMVSNTMYAVSAQPVIEIAEGESMLLRVYPWYNSSSSATGKYLCLSYVTIHGVAEEVSGVKTLSEDAESAVVVEELYYDIMGIQRNSAPEKGIYLVKQIYDDGSVSVSKVIK
ncbi:MAG: GDSL-type esterase/lipase family protein [Porphyromonadaceae bacterium]|nr:GDSL-type esterase/lipase family protein [Porphyromonadaceae bacterium]